jgi:hypothetical protein
MAVYRTLAARLLAGANVATLHAALQVTVPVMKDVVPGPATVKVPVLIVAGSMPVLKVALIV